MDPRDLRQFAQVLEHRRAGGAQIHRPCAAFLPAQQVEAHVRGDAVQPRPQRGAVVELLVGPPSADERLLDGVLGVERRRQHAVAVRRQLGAMLLELPFELGGNSRHRGHATSLDRGSDEFSSARSSTAAKAEEEVTVGKLVFTEFASVDGVFEIPVEPRTRAFDVLGARGSSPNSARPRARHAGWPGRAWDRAAAQPVNVLAAHPYKEENPDLRGGESG